MKWIIVLSLLQIQLPDRYHSDIVNGVESTSAQQELEFATYAARTPMSSGENMLSWLHGQGRLKKICLLMM